MVICCLACLVSGGESRGTVTTGGPMIVGGRACSEDHLKYYNGHMDSVSMTL